MGTPEFAVPALKELIKEKFDIVHVYTQPPKKSNRGLKIEKTPIHVEAEKNNLNIHHPSSLKNEQELNFFRKINPDLVIVVAYGQIIPENFLSLSKKGFINIHASLLPYWRGAAPIQ
ncbi:MAG: methionyl-tRNA formyltransferase, partial [Proteobacteria bacterium]|nr:methionyl-tRNA formyltransferase [Pseudomonadota bacterium]